MAIFSLERVCVAVVMLCSISACVDTTHNGLIFDPAKVAQIERGKSTMTDVVALFGKTPALVTQYDGRKLASYTYTASDTTSTMMPETAVLNPSPIVGRNLNDPIGLPLIQATAAVMGNGVRVELDARDVQVLEIHYSADDIVEDDRLDDCNHHACHPVEASGASKP